MSRIKIETLTSVHIGSGETLQYGNDFVTGKSGDDDIIGIVDARKVMNLIGEEKIDKWVHAIEKGTSTSDIVKQFAPKATIEDYSQRIILGWSIVQNTDTLKEQIHDGMGWPYIPGSSIKGAIRTAVLASLMEEKETVNEDSLFTKDRYGNIKKDKYENAIVKADIYEKELFGDDPNSDIFRFLQVGDAIFGDNYEVAIRMVNINERERQSFWDTSKSQLIEAIGPEDKSEFNMNFKKEQYQIAQEEHAVHVMPSCMDTISVLFQTINEHTKLLIEQEIDYWNARKDEDDSCKVDVYLEKMNEIKSVVEKCEKGTSCVLRIGHGSGWRFITGAWTETFDNFYDVVVPASRPNNKKYEEYNFPKTRRVDDECELLGFVKLTICE